MTERNLTRKDLEVVPNPVENSHVPTSAGTFSIRRARYFTEAKEPLLTAEQQRALVVTHNGGHDGHTA
jgi:hypothetical protein